MTLEPLDDDDNKLGVAFVCVFKKEADGMRAIKASQYFMIKETTYFPACGAMNSLSQILCGCQ